MDAELYAASSVMGATFERRKQKRDFCADISKSSLPNEDEENDDGDDDDEIDVDFNLLKNMLESHSMAVDSFSGGGRQQLGPAEILLSHFGVDIPLPAVAARRKQH